MQSIEEEVSTVMGESAPVSGTGSAPLSDSASAKSSSRRICLRCFAYKADEGLYRAECIDLDIGTEASTLEGAARGLSDAISGYLTVVLEDVKTDEEIPQAIRRPSPLSHRLHYHVGFVLYKVLLVFLTPKQPKRKFYRTPYGLDSAHCQI